MRRLAPLVLRGERAKRLESLPSNILVHNLVNGVPFSANSVDAVYHSHLLEHLDRATAPKFLLEVKRVLKPGGVHRIVVPDFEIVCTDYTSHISLCDREPKEMEYHDVYVERILEQSVRKEAYGTCRQSPFLRKVENLILGDARKRGETHQWMYDRISLKSLLCELGFSDVMTQEYNTSKIKNWDIYGLDVDDEGCQYKPKSLYIEGVK